MPVLNALLEVPPEVRQAFTTPRPPASPPANASPQVHSSTRQEATSKYVCTSSHGSAPQAALADVQEHGNTPSSSCAAVHNDAELNARDNAAEPHHSHANDSSIAAGSRPSAMERSSSQEASKAAAAPEPGSTCNSDPSVRSSCSLAPGNGRDQSDNAIRAACGAGSPASSNHAQASPEHGGAAQLIASSSSHTGDQALREDVAHAEGNKAGSDEPLAHASNVTAHDKLQADAFPHRSGTHTPGSDHTAAADNNAAPASECQPAADGAAVAGKAQSKKPTCLHAVCWTQHLPDQADFDLPGNLAMCSPPDAQISFDAALTAVDALIERLYGPEASSSWDSQQGLQDDESDEEAVEALSHALEQTAVDN